MDLAVLLLVFKRPSTTREVVDALSLSKPARLYVAADGPRNIKEVGLCAEARQVATAVTWDCEVRTLYRESNLGSKRAVEEALDWFFSYEAYGVILEDDCVPSASFLPFCLELLKKYENDERIGAIAGSSYAPPGSVPDSYYYSRYPFIWGWATWSRAWAKYHGAMTAWPAFREAKRLQRLSEGSFGFVVYWTDLLDQFFAGRPSTAWDYQWVFANWLAGYSACVPKRNLVSNVGFGNDASHHSKFNSDFHARPSDQLDFPLKHPLQMRRRDDLDLLVDRHIYHLPRHAIRIMIQQRLPFGGFLWRQARRIKTLFEELGR